MAVLPPDEFKVSGVAHIFEFGKITPPWPIGKAGFETQATIVPQKLFTLNELTVGDNEIIGLRFTIPNRFQNPERLMTNAWLHTPDGRSVAAGGGIYIDPGDWLWTKHGFIWAGPPYEIDRGGIYRVEFKVLSGGVVSGFANIYFEVVSELPPPEPPENFADIILSFLKDVFLEGMTIQAALTKWNILPAWIGNLINSIIDLFSVNIAPEGEAPVRVMFLGGGTVLKQLPKITVAAAERIAAELLEGSASKILALAAKNPAGVRAAILSMSDEVIEKLFTALSKSATGRIALARLMSILREGVAQKAAGAFGFAGLAGRFISVVGIFFAIVYLFKFIGFDFPAYMSNLRKEIPEPSQMAVWLAIESAQMLKTREAWEAARATNEQYLKFINVTDENTRSFVSINPWLADIYTSASDTQRAQQESYKKIIDDALAVIVPPTEKATLTMNSTPTGAKIYVDDVYIFEQTPTTILIDPGSRKITLKLADYEDDITTYTFSAGETVTWNIQLTPIAPPITKGTLMLTTDPADAVITIAGQPEIRTAGTYELEPGSYVILASKTGYYDKSATALIKTGETSNVSITLIEMPPPPPPPPEKGTLIIDSNPQGAKIYINGTYQFTLTPFTKELDPGSYVIRLELEGFVTSEESVTLSAGETKTYSKTMEMIIEPPPPEPPPELPPPELPPIVIPLPPAGPLYNAWKANIRGVDSETQQELAAWILVNDDFIGKSTPFAVFLYPEAEYNVKLRLRGYHQGETTFTTPKLPEM